jgi:hypothetical protein
MVQPTTAAAKPIGKVRNPWTVLILSIVTLGIYGIIYMYMTLQELKNYRGQGWSGGLYLIFAIIFPPPLIAIPWLLPAWVGRMYAEDGKEKPITGMSGFWIFLPLIGPIVLIFKVQNRLNEFWRTKGAA